MLPPRVIYLLLKIPTPEMRSPLLNCRSGFSKTLPKYYMLLLLPLVDAKSWKESPHYWRHGSIQEQDLKAHRAESDVKGFSQRTRLCGTRRNNESFQRRKVTKSTTQLFCILMQTKRQLCFIYNYISKYFKSCLLLNLGFNLYVLDLTLF